MLTITRKTTIEDLRRNAWKVRIHHYRNVNPDATKNEEMEIISLSSFRDHPIDRARMGKGGKTVVWVTAPNSSETFCGISNCSCKDSFCYKRGTRIALRRALLNIHYF